MPRKTGGSSAVTLSYVTIRTNQLNKLTCSKCKTLLDLLQPSIDHPYQFLGICPTCGTWFRVETRAGEPRGVIATLPEIATLIPVEDPLPKHTA